MDDLPDLLLLSGASARQRKEGRFVRRPSHANGMMKCGKVITLSGASSAASGSRLPQSR
jgi:hypothetical protein